MAVENKPEAGSPGYAMTTLDSLIAWGRKFSLYPFTFATACCGIEVMGAFGTHYDVSRFGAEVVRFSPRQADVLLVAGTINFKMAPVLKRIYDQMLEPKWVIAMGACASSGGMFNNYTVLQGVDKIFPVDIHVPGCPPRPEALMEGIVRLHEKIRAGVPPAYQIRGVAQ
jgi:NADH-quinone oxidoreductase subunit B